MSSIPKFKYTAEEYLALDRASDCKSEFVAGEIYAMGGGTPAHALIAGNLIRELGNRLKATSCQVYSGDLRIQAHRDNAFHYPDVVVVCDKPAFREGSKDTVTNPILIVEVLSESTRNYDRGDKFVSYRQLESLREYILIDQPPCHIEHFVRKQSSWEFTELDDMAGELLVPTLDLVPRR